MLLFTRKIEIYFPFSTKKKFATCEVNWIAKEVGELCGGPMPFLFCQIAVLGFQSVFKLYSVGENWPKGNELFSAHPTTLG